VVVTKGGGVSDVVVPRALVGSAVLCKVSSAWYGFGPVLEDAKHTLVVLPCSPGKDLQQCKIRGILL
jgi:hypothetical protein